MELLFVRIKGVTLMWFLFESTYFMLIITLTTNVQRYHLQHQTGILITLYYYF